MLVSSGDLFSVVTACRRLKEAGKLVLVHLDLVAGLGRDPTAVRFLKDEAGAHGVVSPGSTVIVSARKLGIVAVQRLFAHDSPSLETGLRVLEQSRPDFIEVLPGLALPRVAGILRKRLHQPLIAAGLIRSEEEVRAVLRAGAVAVDTSARELWNLGTLAS